MKQLFFSLVLCILAATSNAAPLIKATSNGSWNSAATWDKNRVPATGDTILIPAGKYIAITDDQVFNGQVIIKVYGQLIFLYNNSSLKVGNNSMLIVYSGGKIIGNGSPSQKLRYLNSIIFDGNDMPISGPMMATSTAGFQGFSETPLPVKFIGFTLSRKNADVLVQWSTAQEVNASMYELERSTDGRSWSIIAYVAASGNSSEVMHYAFRDKNQVSAAVYYRIRQVDIDGQFAYTTVASLRNETKTGADIKIAAVQGKVLIQLPQQISGNVTVKFVNAAGQVADQKMISNPSGQVVLSSSLKGNYFIALVSGNAVAAASQVIL